MTPERRRAGRPNKLMLEQRMEARRLLRCARWSQRGCLYQLLAGRWGCSPLTVQRAVLG